MHLELCSFVTCSFYTSMRFDDSANREQRQAQITNANDHAVQGSLVGEWTCQHGRAVFLTLYGQPPKPVGPAVVEVSSHTKFIRVGHGKVISLTKSENFPPTEMKPHRKIHYYLFLWDFHFCGRWLLELFEALRIPVALKSGAVF